MEDLYTALRGTGLHPSTVSKENVTIHTILPSAKKVVHNETNARPLNLSSVPGQERRNER